MEQKQEPPDRPTRKQLAHARKIAPKLGIVLPAKPDALDSHEHELAIRKLALLVRP